MPESQAWVLRFHRQWQDLFCLLVLCLCVLPADSHVVCSEISVWPQWVLLIDKKKNREVLQVVPSGGHDSCQVAQHGQEMFWAIKPCPNLGRVLGSFGNPLLAAQLMILVWGRGRGYALPQRPWSCQRLLMTGRRSLCGDHQEQSRSSTSLRRIYKGLLYAWGCSRKKGTGRPDLFWEASLALG